MSKPISLATRVFVSAFLIMAPSVVFFSSTAFADCTCHPYGHCSASASDDWAPTSYDYRYNTIVFYIDGRLPRLEQSLIAQGIERWRPAMAANGLRYQILPLSTRQSDHGIHEITIGFIQEGDGSILGVTYDGGSHHRHIIIDGRFWYGSHTNLERVAVVTHEAGHVLGLGHSADHADLMHDHYNPNNMYPTRRDLTRAANLLSQSVRPR